MAEWLGPCCQEGWAIFNSFLARCLARHYPAPNGGKTLERDIREERMGPNSRPFTGPRPQGPHRGDAFGLDE